MEINKEKAVKYFKLFFALLLGMRLHRFGVFKHGFQISFFTEAMALEIIVILVMTLAYSVSFKGQEK